MSCFSESDLTDFDDEEEVPLSSQKSSKKKPKDAPDEDGSYRIRGALKVPRVANYTTQSLHDQVMAGDIDLNPEYQRDVVWPETKQTGLIDSLFRNFYVPPVIFVVEMRDDGSEHRTCVDGKQRLTSINRFLQGQIPYKDPYSNEKLWFSLPADSRGKLLPEKYRKLFRNKQIVCIEYENLRPDNEREIFQRVQLGMALTKAEKLQAINTPRSNFARELMNAYVMERIGTYLVMDTNRGGAFKLSATAVMGIENWAEKHDIPTSVDAWINKNNEVSESTKQNSHTVLSIFSELTESQRLRNMLEIRGDDDKVKKFAPMEFVATCLLIHHYKDKLTMAQMAEAVRMMRRDVRGKEKDVRLNSRVSKLMSEFINKLKVKKLKADTGKPVASKTVPGGSKRKRDESADGSESEEEEEEEEVPTKRSRKAAAKAKATKKTPSKSATKTRDSAEPATPSLRLPRGPTALQSAPTVSQATATTPSTIDSRRRGSDIIVPKTEPSPTPAQIQPFQLAGSPPPPTPITPAANWPNPYPTPQGQTPSPNPNNYPNSTMFHPDRLAALRAAKEVTSGNNNTPQFWPPGNAGRGFPFTPPSSQFGSQQPQLQLPPGLEALLARIGNAGYDGSFGVYNQAIGQPQQQQQPPAVPIPAPNPGVGQGPDQGWAGQNKPQ
ncbi:hypothetical protein BXZ70DRAFT_1004839 [Cristinia sonorae]|uniref:GmrSD restriction endonucleases N-terminal domain-containing protein n=1 Tax=Cristinia sonorae TaxID=1940300 RepID=A0A8K0XTG2_9AGAR|nr:hypothetical protein BXZ70DRAFT_1004839 [Cristinia sonorae]